MPTQGPIALALTSTSTTTTTTTTVPPRPGVFTLGSPGVGDQVSQPLLDLAVDRPPQNGAELPNYDTDRNADPGLTVVASPQGLVTDDPAGVRHDPTIDAVADTFAPVVYDLSVTPTPYVVPAGRRLELRVAVRNASTNDALIGYDATGYPSELVITPPPAAAAAAPVVANVAGSTPAGSSPMAPVLVLVLAALGGIVVVGRRPRSDVTPVIG